VEREILLQIETGTTNWDNYYKVGCIKKKYKKKIDIFEKIVTPYFIMSAKVLNEKFFLHNSSFFNFLNYLEHFCIFL